MAVFCRIFQRPVKHRSFRRLLVMLLAACVILLALDLYRSNFVLTTAEYTVTSDRIDSPVRMVFLSDLHLRSFGKDNQDLIDRITDAAPDLIFITGDLINNDSSPQDVDTICTLLNRLSAIAPVYFSMGNTEEYYQREVDSTLFDQFAAAGVTVLENSYCDVTVGGASLRIGGMYQFAYAYGNVFADTAEYAFLETFTDTQLPTVMLCHRPDSFIYQEPESAYRFDLLLCGHTHGGVIRLPWIGSVYLPVQGWFPTYDYGQFDLFGTPMIITSGFAGYNGIPRLLNPPEIVCVTLTPA